MSSCIRKQIKKALYSQQMADPFFCSRYRFSPYSGCAHGCRYCDGRAEKYYFDGDFEKEIIIRENIDEILSQDLSRVREKGLIDAGSGISDIYQPLEKKYRLMRQCIKVINTTQMGMIFSTKSAGALDDLPLWKEKIDKGGLIFMMSLITLDDKERQIFEPGASPVKSRLMALEQFAQTGAVTGVLMMPHLPGINDNTEKIERLVRTLKDCGVSFIIPGTLTLRPGRQKTLYMETVKRHYPEVLPQTEFIFSENRASGNSVYSYRNTILPPIIEILNNYGYSGLIDHKIFRNFVSLPDEITILLDHLGYLYKGNKSAEKRLNIVKKHWDAWIKPARTYFNRKRSLPDNYLDLLIQDILSSENKTDLFGNIKTADFFANLLDRNFYFDYRMKKWKKIK